MTPDTPAMDEKGRALKDIEACLDEAVSYLVDLAGAKPDRHSPNNCRVKIDEARFYARHLASLKASQEAEVVKAVADIASERRRQVEAEGWTAKHDDQHNGGELSRAAACYALGKLRVTNFEGGSVHLWPWEDYWFKATDKRRNLIKAGALIVAEIERLDRLATPQPSPDAEGDAA